MLSESDQAALIAHESFYVWLRDQNEESNSLRVRRAIGYVFAGNPFVLAIPTVPEQHVSCISADVGAPQNRVSLWLKGTNPNGQATYNVYFERIEGTPLIGLPTGKFSMTFPQDFINFITTGVCPANTDAIGTWGYDPKGPVEWDRGLSLQIVCKNSLLSFLLKDTKPGAESPTTIPLTCKF